MKRILFIFALIAGAFIMTNDAAAQNCVTAGNCTVEVHIGNAPKVTFNNYNSSPVTVTWTVRNSDDRIEGSGTTRVPAAKDGTPGSTFTFINPSTKTGLWVKANVQICN